MKRFVNDLNNDFIFLDNSILIRQIGNPSLIWLNIIFLIYLGDGFQTIICYLPYYGNGGGGGGGGGSFSSPSPSPPMMKRKCNFVNSSNWSFFDHFWIISS